MRDAAEHNEEGRRLLGDGELDAAAEAFRASARAAPAWSVPWFNLGLCHKRAGRWAECAACNEEAVARDPGDEGAWWNLGISATALGDWGTARRAWRRVGIEVPDAEGPLHLRLGPTPIRLDPGGRGEVVWCDRIDPARAVIRNVPLPESGHRFGDVLLHDGEPRGSRMHGEREVPVFDCLARLVPSPYRTFLLDLPGATAEERVVLEDVALESDAAAEDWSRSIAFLCESCSLGRPHRQHDDALRGRRPERPVALAARSEEEVRQVLERWRERSGHKGSARIIDVARQE